MALSIGGLCGCCGMTILVNGCPGILLGEPIDNPVVGITINVYDHAGGTLLSSGITGPGGVATVSVDPGTYWVTFTGTNANRFAESSGRTVTWGPVSNLVTLTAATGYRCVDWIGEFCGIPLSNTISYTITKANVGFSISGTIAWDNINRYTGIYTYTYGGCLGCAAGTVQIRVTITQFGVRSATWPTLAGASNCPGVGTSRGWSGGGAAINTCPPAYTSTGAWPQSAAGDSLTCSAPVVSGGVNYVFSE
jgi:hypothetical protein